MQEGKVLAERAGRMSGTLQQESEVAIGEHPCHIPYMRVDYCSGTKKSPDLP